MTAEENKRIVSELEFTFPFYCHKCNQCHHVLLTEEPKRVICPQGHDQGVWSYDGEQKRVCKICVNEGVILHRRKRHDHAHR